MTSDALGILFKLKSREIAKILGCVRKTGLFLTAIAVLNPLFIPRAGMGVEQIKGLLTNLKVEVIEPVIIKGHPRVEDFRSLTCSAY